MRTELVEIFSEKSSATILRKFGCSSPGVLVCPLILRSMCVRADEAYAVARRKLQTAECRHLNVVRRELWGLLKHYTATLDAAGLPPPF